MQIYSNQGSQSEGKNRPCFRLKGKSVSVKITDFFVYVNQAKLSVIRLMMHHNFSRGKNQVIFSSFSFSFMCLDATCFVLDSESYSDSVCT